LEGSRERGGDVFSGPEGRIKSAGNGEMLDYRKESGRVGQNVFEGKDQIL